MGHSSGCMPVRCGMRGEARRGDATGSVQYIQTSGKYLITNIPTEYSSAGENVPSQSMSNGINWPAQRERGGSLDETRRNFELEKRSFLLLAQRAQYVGTFLGT